MGRAHFLYGGAVTHLPNQLDVSGEPTPLDFRLRRRVQGPDQPQPKVTREVCIDACESAGRLEKRREASAVVQRPRVQQDPARMRLDSLAGAELRGVEPVRDHTEVVA